MKVFINPGHAPDGVPDPGACANGLTEAERAACIGKIVAHDLEFVGYEVETLQSDSLEDICAAANASGADVFVSIHCNSSGSEEPCGTETWYFNNSGMGRFLASRINNQLVSSIGLEDRGARAAIPGINGLYVLSNTDAVAVLVETAFISNSGDAAILQDKPDKVAHAIARGITDYAAGV